MYTAALAEIKKELQALDHARLLELCTRLARYKKENKELLSYILFDSSNEYAYIENLKLECDTMFEEVNTRSVYLAKKTLRKILRFITRFCKYSGKATTSIEMLLYFCTTMKALPLKFEKNTVLKNIYTAQLKKVEKLLPSLHEDLQYDYREKMRFLSLSV